MMMARDADAATHTGVKSSGSGQPQRNSRPIERVRGTHDRLSGERGSAQALVSRLGDRTTSHGYQFVDTPILEHTELFLRKSGGDRIAQLYSFVHRGRDVALRPEFTASVMRLYIEQLQNEPLPLRLAYSGPVFRYEKPQAGRSRQFTEFGCELIGATGPVADAEIISLALQGLRDCGLRSPHIVLGHIGVVINFLADLNIDQRAQDWLTWSMERLRKGDDAAHALPPHLARLEAALEDDSLDGDPTEDVSPETIAAILRQAGVEFQGGARTPEEIVRGLFAKRRRRYDAAVLREAASFVEQLTRLTGPPDAVLEPLRELVRSNGLETRPLDELEQIVTLLSALDFDQASVTIDLGMGRGLHYYTGMLFEIYASDASGPQLCGGGRYDDLAQVLGARQPVPACGFSYGVERVLAACGIDDMPETPPAILVRQADSPASAVRLAAQLRAVGWVANVDLRNRNITATRRAALRQGYVAIAEVAGAGVQVTRLDDGTTTTHDNAPRVVDVL
jgi:histidyl-tRNA synthetase